MFNSAEIKPIISDEKFGFISAELNINGNKCKILKKYFEYVIKHKEIFKENYKSKLEDCRDICKKEKAKYVNNKLSKLPIHNKLKHLDLNNVMMDFDGTSLYTFAM